MELSKTAKEIIDNVEEDIDKVKKLDNGDKNKIIAMGFDNGDFAFIARRELENYVKKVKRFDKQNGICKRFDNHTCNHWKKPSDKLGRMITNIICNKEFEYFGYGRNIFHRESAESIAIELTRDLKSKLKWIWIILRS